VASRGKVRPAVFHPVTTAFALRMTAATLLCLWLAFTLQLGNSYSGPVTVWLVGKPSHRATMTLSAARMAGTILGCLAAVSIIAVAAQAAYLALVLMALWMALCAFAATFDLAPIRAYTFELAGFSLLTIIAASWNHPNVAFQQAIDAGAAVCAGVFSLFVVDHLAPFGTNVPPDPSPPRRSASFGESVKSASIAGVTVLAAGAFWMATAWPHGVNFLFAAGLVTVFFAPTLAPDLRSLEYSHGIALSGLAGALYSFVVLPHYTAFAAMAVVMLPLLIVGGYLVAHPQIATRGFLIMMAYIFILMRPENDVRVDPVNFLNAGMAYTLGGVFGTIVFRIAGRGTLP
jgi:uncharacterized membrane protein YccC